MSVLSFKKTNQLSTNSSSYEELVNEYKTISMSNNTMNIQMIKKNSFKMHPVRGAGEKVTDPNFSERVVSFTVKLLKILKPLWNKLKL